jgi:hypothetical protein
MKLIEFEIKKISPSPKDQWEAIEFMVNAQSQLTEALFIMKSLIENNSDKESKEWHEKRIKDFIKQFEK